jgi:hypothetical protein
MLCYLGNQHAILSALRDLIEAAEHSIVLQMYLFAANGDQTLLLPREGAFPYADTVAGWLVEKKQRVRRSRSRCCWIPIRRPIRS